MLFCVDMTVNVPWWNMAFNPNEANRRCKLAAPLNVVPFVCADFARAAKRCSPASVAVLHLRQTSSAQASRAISARS